MRGGNGIGLFLLKNHLPSDPEKRNEMILSIFGSSGIQHADNLSVSDPDPLADKFAIIAVSSRNDADIEYTFGQVDINKRSVNYENILGNITPAVGPYCIAQGLVNATEPYTRVRIFNTNMKRVIRADVPVKNGKPADDETIIKLDFAGMIGSKCGKLLPTGNATDTLSIKGFGNLTVSMVDAGSPTVFTLAADLGLSGIETPDQIDGNTELLNILENIQNERAMHFLTSFYCCHYLKGLPCVWDIN